MNYQYTNYLASPYHVRACPNCAVAVGSELPTERDTESTLAALDTGTSLTGLVEDLARSPFAVRLPGEEDPVGGLLLEKEQMLRAKIKHLADTLASRYVLSEQALWMMNHEQCRLQGEIWELESWPHIEANRTKLESEILKLEKDKKDETASTWKDVFAVKSELIEAIALLRKLQNQECLLAEPLVAPSLEFSSATPTYTGYREGLTY